MKEIASLSDLPQGPIYIYGTGAAGRMIFSRIAAHHPEAVRGFVDSYARGEIAGLPILDPVKSQSILENATILIASQSWREIGLRLAGIGLPHLLNAYPLYNAPVASAVEVDNGFLSAQAQDDLISAIAACPTAKRFAVLGSNGSAQTLVEALRSSSVAERITRHYDIAVYQDDAFRQSASGLFEDYRNGLFDRIILAVSVPDVRLAMRRIRMIQGIDVPVWLPARHVEQISPSLLSGTRLEHGLHEIREELTERSGVPMMVVVPPCAGTMRFLPQIEYLLQILGWKSVHFQPLTCNPAFYSRFRSKYSSDLFDNTKKLSETYIYENTSSYFWFLNSLKNFEYVIVHDHSINLEAFSRSHCKICVLMRDPRDIINSFFFRSHPFDLQKRSADDFMFDLLDGEVRFAAPEHGHRWASAKEWTDSYLAAMESPNMEIVRFEDLHRDEIGTLRDILARLELTPNPFVEVTDTVLRSAARLGSFEHQTNGQAVRGEDRQGIVGQTSCRKGVVGDWRSTFTPAVVEKFKRLTGDALIRLGYEDNMDWGLDQPGPS